MQLLLSALKKANLDIEHMNIAMQVYGNSDVLQAVALGSGAGFVTRSLLAISGQYNNIVPVQVKRFRVDRYLYLVRTKEQPFHEGERQFWEYALQTRWRAKDFSYNTLNSTLAD